MNLTPSPDTRTCYGCAAANPPKDFCGNCGAPLQIQPYIQREIKIGIDRLAGTRDLVERESAIRIFERAYTWMKLVAGAFIGAVLLIAAFLGAVGWSKWSDLNAATEAARKAVLQAAAAAVQTVNTTVDRSQDEIRTAELRVAADVNRLQIQTESMTAIRPKIAAMQDQLLSAVNTLRHQQQVLSSNELFVKKLMSSFKTETFVLEKTPPERLRVHRSKEGTLHI